MPLVMLRGKPSFGDPPQGELPRTPLRNCPKSPGEARNVASRGPGGSPFARFWSPNTGQNPDSELYPNPFSDSLKGQVRGISLLGTWVNKSQLGAQSLHTWH